MQRWHIAGGGGDLRASAIAALVVDRFGKSRASDLARLFRLIPTPWIIANKLITPGGDHPVGDPSGDWIRGSSDSETLGSDSTPRDPAGTPCRFLDSLSHLDEPRLLGWRGRDVCVIIGIIRYRLSLR